MILSEVKYKQIHNGIFVNVRLIHHNHVANGQSTQKPVKILNTNVTKIQCRVTPLLAMEHPGNPLNPICYASLLQACTDMKSLEQAHAHLAVCGLDQNTYLETRLVSMYALVGNLENARQLFDKIVEPNVFAWNSMIRRYATGGSCEEALCFYYRMQQAGRHADNLTFPFVLRACAGLLALREGKEIHCHIIRSGYETDIFTGSALVNFYVKCGVLEDARQVFDKMSQRNVVSWTSMIAGYACNGHANEALTLFHQMQESNVKPNPVTVASVLPAYADLKDLQQGERIHDYIIRNKYESNVFVGVALINMYIKCGSVEKARQVFDRMSQRNLVSWTAMIAGYAQNGLASEALALFDRMQLEDMTPDSVTMVSILSACGQLGAIQQGKCIHDYVIKNGFESDPFVGTALIDMYSKCGSMDFAHRFFGWMPERNAVSWNALITGYAKNGLVDKALRIFKEMEQRNTVSWNAMIAGLAQNGHDDQALNLFQQMQLEGARPDSTTFTIVLPACANMAALEQGIEIHENIIRSRFGSDNAVMNSLIDMYAKCGSIQKARELFKTMHHPDIISWNTMIGGYAMHGCSKEALKFFEQMKHSGMIPDHVTLVSILSACSHAGLVDEGYQYFNSMTKHYNLVPSMEHYICMVDLLGRSGHLDEAQDFINKMPMNPDAPIWSCLLGACRVHNNIELAKCAAEHLFELDPKNTAPYVLLSNIYAAAGRWDDIEKIRRMMKERGVKKRPGCSWIEVNKEVHAFLTGDRLNLQI